MLLDPEKHFANVAAREMAPRTREQRQRDVYDSHRHRIFSVSCYMTGSEIEAEDLLTGTFVRAFGRAEEPDREMIDQSLLEELREQMVLQDDACDLPLTPAEALPPGRNILRTDLEEAIRCLPSTERLVFLLMDVEGYPAPRIAGLLAISTSEVLRTAVAARIRLRAKLATLSQSDQQAA